MTRTFRIKLGLAGAMVVAACSPTDLLKVSNPDVIKPTDVTTPGGVAALYAGAFGDFDVAYVSDNGGEAGLVLVTGQFSDELANSETFPTRLEYDHRGPIDLKNTSLLTMFRRIHRARRSAETAAAAIKSVDTAPLTDKRIGDMYALAGFIYTGMGEAYCNGMPVSDASLEGTLTYSDPLTTTQVFNRAVDRFDSALKYYGANADASLAKVGLGRALLDLNQPAAAAAAVAGVPTTYVFNLTFNLGVTAQNNPIYGFMNLNARFSVANLDGGNGLNFRSALDPRVPWARVPANRVGFDKATPQFDQGKYFSESAPIPLATGVEARLIEAEAALAANDPTTWLNTLNTLRANTALYPKVFPSVFPLPPAGSSFLPGFTQPPPLVDPVDATARLNLMFRERAFWLYLTDHRMGDLRRLVRQYGQSADAVFPGGGGAQYVVDGNPKGGTFGSDVNLPIPFDEQNNPKFTQCIDRNP